MFSSLASFLFGSNTNTNCEANSETTATTTATGASEERNTNVNLVDAENLIEVTSLTPSIAGAGEGAQCAIKRGKNKHNNAARQQNKRKGIKTQLPLSTKQTKLLNISDSCDEEEFDEDEWFIVEKEEEEDDLFSTRTNAGGENVSNTNKPANTNAAKALTEQRISHSLYSGPRPQKQRNFLQKTRNNNNNRPGKGLSVSTLSPSRTVSHGCGHEITADGGITRSLYVASTSSQQNDEKPFIATNGLDMINKMEESWFITPPPCFTSAAPIIMETSPFENLLIEHPSMSVYHSIKKARETTADSLKVDIDVEVNNDVAEKLPTNETTTKKKDSQAVQSRSSGSGYRLDRQSVAQLKQELLARNVQKTQNKKERKDICRSAIQRANKVRDVQSRNHTQRRSDRQHCKLFSNANNNRKSNSC